MVSLIEFKFISELFHVSTAVFEKESESVKDLPNDQNILVLLCTYFSKIGRFLQNFEAFSNFMSKNDSKQTFI